MSEQRHGYFGAFGGQFMPETLMNAVIELEEAYNKYKDDQSSYANLRIYIKNIQVVHPFYIMQIA